MSQVKDTFDIRLSRRGNYLTRAYKHNKASILFALYLSEFLRVDIEKALEGLLKRQGFEVVKVDTEIHKDLPSFFLSLNSNNTIFFVHHIERISRSSTVIKF